MSDFAINIKAKITTADAVQVMAVTIYNNSALIHSVDFAQEIRNYGQQRRLRELKRCAARLEKDEQVKANIEICKVDIEILETLLQKKLRWIHTPEEEILEIDWTFPDAQTLFNAIAQRKETMVKETIKGVDEQMPILQKEICKWLQQGVTQGSISNFKTLIKTPVILFGTGTNYCETNEIVKEPLHLKCLEVATVVREWLEAKSYTMSVSVTRNDYDCDIRVCIDNLAPNTSTFEML